MYENTDIMLINNVCVFLIVNYKFRKIFAFFPIFFFSERVQHDIIY